MRIVTPKLDRTNARLKGSLLQWRARTRMEVSRSFLRNENAPLRARFRMRYGLRLLRNRIAGEIVELSSLNRRSH